MIYIIGDSHANMLVHAYSALIKNDTGFSYECNFNSDIVSKYKDSTGIAIEAVVYSGRTAYSVDYNEYDVFDSWEKEGSKLFVFLGYNDIKNTLPEYQNAEETVIRYINKVTNKFKGFDIRFIEPVPQFKNALWGNQNPISWQERYRQQHLFNKHLKYYSKKNNIKKPLRISKMIGSSLLDDHYLGSGDHLKEQYYQTILKNIVLN
jgi:hypothetical protein